ncbi:MAG: DUF4907 domain-containing protein [Breznakibacter sp.]
MTTIDRTQKKVIWFYVVALVIAIGALAVYYFQKHESSQEYAVTAVKLSNGYGYQISINGKVYIYQEYIPSIEGKHSFRDSQSALKAGELVLGKIMKGEVPMMTKDELKQIGIDIDDLKE